MPTEQMENVLARRILRDARRRLYAETRYDYTMPSYRLGELTELAFDDARAALGWYARPD
tara:strand:+ start:1288 stop:1467 length:180 start_codon:yes stop_codon:yes gene_type:complete